MPLSIIRQDISRVRADAIVNSANPSPVVGRGVDSMLHAAAGPVLLEERRRIGTIAPGEVAVTSAGNLPAHMVIHTVGPVWRGGAQGEDSTLRNCYANSLAAAFNAGCASIAFPLISTGTYGFPKDLALRVAKRAIEGFLDAHDIDVMLVVYDAESFQLSRALSHDVQNYLMRQGDGGATGGGATPVGTAGEGGVAREGDEALLGDRGFLMSFSAAIPPCSTDVAEADSSSAAERGFPPPGAASPGSASPRAAEPASAVRPAGKRKPRVLTRWAEPKAAVTAIGGRRECAAPGAAERSLDDVVSQVGESFTEALLRMIDERGLDDPEVYRRANIDRKLFSKMRNNPTYQPKKGTAVGLAVALRLDIDETLDLIGRAGYTLSNASVADLIVRYFIERNQWDVNDINMVLFKYDQPLIGR